MAMLLRSLLPRVGILSPPVGCPRLIRCLSSAAVCPPARAAVYHQHGAPDHVLQFVLPLRISHPTLCFHRV
jgi:hypothetical protein